jgi:hypothetical protein
VSVDVSSEIVIARPRGVVANWAADPETIPRWYTNIDSVDWKTPPPLAEGSQLTFKAHFLGRSLSYVYEVTEFLPGEFRHISDASNRRKPAHEAWV